MTTGWSEEDIHETDPHRRLLNRCGPERRRARLRGPRRGCHIRAVGSRQDEGRAADHLDRGIHRARDHDLLRHGGARIPHARRQGVRGELARPPPPPPKPIPPPGPPNVEILPVDAGPAGGVNPAFVSVQVCVPGTTTCQTIDHVEVDTGSIGLRILADVPFTLTLPQATNGSGGPPMTECLQFADGSSYGSLRVADITLPGSGEHAPNVVVQLIGDSTYPVPTGTITGQSACPGIPQNSVQAVRGNGVLGVGPVAQDRGSACVAP